MQKLFPGIDFTVYGLWPLPLSKYTNMWWAKFAKTVFCQVLQYLLMLCLLAQCCWKRWSVLLYQVYVVHSHCICVWLPSVTITKSNRTPIVAMFVLLTLAYGDGWVAAWLTLLLAQLCQLMSALGWNSTVHCLPHIVMMLPSNSAITDMELATVDPLVSYTQAL